MAFLYMIYRFIIYLSMYRFLLFSEDLELYELLSFICEEAATSLSFNEAISEVYFDRRVFFYHDLLSL